MHTNQSSAPKRFWRFNIFWIGWLAILSYLCDKRPQELPEISLLQFEGADKLVHFIFYFTLSNLLLFGFKMQSAYPVLKKNTYKIVFVFAFVIITHVCLYIVLFNHMMLFVLIKI